MSLPLPKPLKSALSKLVLGPEPIRQYEAIGLGQPQQQIRVLLCGLDEPSEVTTNNVVAALRPLTIGICLPSSQGEARIRTARLRLLFQETAPPEKVVGEISLRFTRAIDLGAQRYCLCETTRHKNRCSPWLRLQAHYWLLRRSTANYQKRNPYNFFIPPAELFSLFVFYTCPRPVVLVTVVHGKESNIFPMDLIGPTASPLFSMALRSTSPAVRLMRESGRMALTAIPFDYKQAAYKLGAHHKKESIDWNGLGFPVYPSPRFDLPVPSEGLTVKEVEVRQVHEVGSHTLFLTEVVNERAMRSGGQLCHIQGFYQAYLKQRGRAL